jgi:hypothetical protein
MLTGAAANGLVYDMQLAAKRSLCSLEGGVPASIEFF